MNRLKQSQVKAYREQQWAKQNGICALCNEYIDPEEAVLDHNHFSSLVRKVLHRGCNVMEGVITNNMIRNKVTQQRLENILKNLIEYQTTEHTDILHPSYRTSEEKAARIKKRRTKAKKSNK